MPRIELIPVLDPKAVEAGRKLPYRCEDCNHEFLASSPQSECPECEGLVTFVPMGR